MEVLNRNQRRSAYWRIVGIVSGILLFLATILFSTTSNYKSQGSGELELIISEHQRDSINWLKSIRGLEGDIKKLKSQVTKCRENNMNGRLENCLDRLEGKEERLTKLEGDLESCQGKLNAATSF